MAAGERETLPFSEQDWVYLRTLLSRITDIDELRNNLKLTYLEGLAHFHLSDFGAAMGIFKQLDYNSQSYGSRIIKHYLWADSKGIVENQVPGLAIV